MTHWLGFQTTHPLDLKSMADNGVPVYEEKVAELPKRGFLFYRDDGRFFGDLSASAASESAGTAKKAPL